LDELHHFIVMSTLQHFSVDRCSIQFARDSKQGGPRPQKTNSLQVNKTQQNTYYYCYSRPLWLDLSSTSRRRVSRYRSSHHANALASTCKFCRPMLVREAPIESVNVQTFHNNACNIMALHKHVLTARLDRTGPPQPSHDAALARLTPMTRLLTPPQENNAHHPTDKSSEEPTMRFCTPSSTAPNVPRDSLANYKILTLMIFCAVPYCLLKAFY
jgi:hypothetical protein